MEGQVPELEQKMLDRVRRHMVTSVGGIVLAVMGVASASMARRTLYADTPAPGWLMAIPALCILIIPAIGWWSTYKNLRCPSCNRWVAMQVSWNASIFGSTATKTCMGCGEKIFGDEIVRRFRRMILVAFGLGLLFFAVGTALSAIFGRSH